MNTTVKNIIKCLLFALPAVALVSPMDMFFPFITGKAFLFRVAVELCFFLYISLVFVDKSFRPKWNPLTVSFSAFVAVIFIADISSINPQMALWSNFERMEGFVTLAHLFAYFVVISSVFKEKKDWNTWTLSTIAVSIFMTLFSFLQLGGEAVINQGGVRVDGQLGNASYLAVYMLFHVFFLFYLFVSEKVNMKGISESIAVGGFGYVLYYFWRISHPTLPAMKVGWIILFFTIFILLASLYFRFSEKFKNSKIIPRIFIGVLLFAEITVLYHTATRGAILGFLGGLFLAALFLAFKEKESKLVRRSAIVIISAVILLTGGFYVFRNSSFVQESPVLSRFASLSLDTKGQARNYIWPMAIEGFKEHPVLGWGQEGFIYVFTKYYVPEMVTQEPWFDRTHNAFLDWLIAGGLLGLIGYLALYLFSIVSLWKSVVFSVREKAIFLGLFAAYAFQSLFIFDNLLSYLLFVSLLAFVSLKNDSTEVVKKKNEVEDIGLPLLLSSVVICVVVILLINARPYKQNIVLANSLSAQSEGISKNIELIKQAIALDSFGTFEARQQLQSLTYNVLNSQTISNADKVDTAHLLVSELELQKDKTPKDVRPYLALGAFLSDVGANDSAIPVLEEAKVLSPKKQQITYTLAKAHIAKGQSTKNSAEVEKGIDMLKATYEMTPQIDQVTVVYGSALIFVGRYEEGITILNTVQDKASLANISIIQPLVENGRTRDAVNMLESAIESSPLNTDIYVLLSNVYVSVHDKVNAIKTLDRLVAAVPSFQSQYEKNLAAINAQLK